MSFIDYAIVLAYLVLSLGLGVYFSRNQTQKGFFIAKKTMGWLPVGLSVMATLFSTNGFVMYPSVAYGSSLRVWLYMIILTAVAPIVMFVFIPVYARLNCKTAYEYLEMRFHVCVRAIASGLFVFLRIGWMASVIYSATLVLASVTGISQFILIILLGVISTTYTMLGGLKAVMWTDVLQFFIFCTTIILTLILIVVYSSDGIGGITSSYFEGRNDLLINFKPAFDLDHGSWAFIIGLPIVFLSTYGADQVSVQRYIAAKSERTSKIGLMLSVLGAWIVIPGLLIIGVGLYSHFQANPSEMITVLDKELGGELPQWRTQGSPDPGTHSLSSYYQNHPEHIHEDVVRNNIQDKVFPQYVRLYFPPGMVGLFLVALMAAVMSSIDSGIHSISTSLTVDIRDRFFSKWKPEDEKREVFQDRLLVVFISSISIFLACQVGDMGDVFAIGKKLTAGFGGPLLSIFILALFFPRVRTAEVVIGTLAGSLIVHVMMFYYTGWFSLWFWPMGFALALSISLVVSFFRKSGKMDHPGRQFTYWHIMRKHKTK